METHVNGISKLSLTNFRCYQSLRIKDLSNNIIIYGPNGAGKTSILEAVSLLSASKGLRNAGTEEIRCLNSNACQWGVAATLSTHNEQVSIGVGNQPTAGNDQKIAKVDGSFINLGEIERYLWLLWLTPQTDKIFAEQSHIGRKFFDHLIKGMIPEYHKQRLKYKKFANERIKALHCGVSDNTWLEAIEHNIADTSLKIIEYRIKYYEAFNEISIHYPSNFPKITLMVNEDIKTSIDKYQNTLLEKLKANREKDHFTGMTNAGPHRNIWEVGFKDRPLPTGNYSTGEQKILLISVILVTTRLYKNYRTGVPILLFDDTIAHLDNLNIERFFEEISDARVQTWSTSTDRPLLSSSSYSSQYINTKSGICIQE